MKSDADARQALSAMMRDARGDMSAARRDALIARELNRGGKMDADFVAEAAKDAEGARTPPFDAAANWAKIERALDLSARAAPIKRRRGWARTAAGALAFVALASIGAIATKAGPWNSLTSVFRPFAGTLGIHLNAQDLDGAGELERLSAVEQVSHTTRDERDVPGAVWGVAARPSWLPEGYAFHAAEVFEDFNEASLTLTYRNGSAELFVQTVVYTKNDSLTAINLFERDDKAVETALSIAISENDGVVSAVRKSGLALQMAWGRLSREEIARVIASIGAR